MSWRGGGKKIQGDKIKPCCLGVKTNCKLGKLTDQMRHKLNEWWGWVAGAAV